MDSVRVATNRGSTTARHEQRAHDTAHPDSAPFTLSDTDCERLLREGVQYYHRYLSFWHLDRFELCARDTRRNLLLFKFVREHAKNERDRMRFDQWRPYVIVMHSRAVATPFVELAITYRPPSPQSTPASVRFASFSTNTAKRSAPRNAGNSSS